MDLPLGFETDFPEGGEESLAVVIVFKDVVVLVAPIHDVMNRSGDIQYVVDEAGQKADVKYAGHFVTLALTLARNGLWKSAWLKQSRNRQTDGLRQERQVKWEIAG